ncbi:MAG: hypothetical protein RL684_870 [Pseudomonadota bacterium]|jgi:type IV secretion system protein VirB2
MRSLLRWCLPILAVLPPPAFALAYPPPAWQAPFGALLRSMTGPIAFGISIVAIVSAGSMLVWGGDLSEFVRRMSMLVLVIGAVMFSVAIVQALFGSGVVIPH